LIIPQSQVTDIYHIRSIFIIQIYVHEYNTGLTGMTPIKQVPTNIMHYNV